MKISVITVSFNNKNELEKTIQSVVNQSYKNIEYIIFDGGSSDGSKEILEKYSDKISFWASEKDNGIFNAMNKGIVKSSGEFIIFLNSGDTFYENTTLENAVKSFDTTHQIYYGNVIRIRKDRESFRTYPEVLDFSYFYNGSLCHQATFIKRQLFFDYFLYNENYKIAADWEFFIYTICKENIPYKYINQTICYYDFNGISSTGKYAEIHQQEKNETLQKYFPTFVNDYKSVAKLNEKRTKQFLYIEKFPLAWKITKAFINIILLFLPKKKFK